MSFKTISNFPLPRCVEMRLNFAAIIYFRQALISGGLKLRCRVSRADRRPSLISSLPKSNSTDDSKLDASIATASSIIMSRPSSIKVSPEEHSEPSDSSEPPSPTGGEVKLNEKVISMLIKLIAGSTTTP